VWPFTVETCVSVRYHGMAMIGSLCGCEYVSVCAN